MSSPWFPVSVDSRHDGSCPHGECVVRCAAWACGRCSRSWRCRCSRGRGCRGRCRTNGRCRTWRGRWRWRRSSARCQDVALPASSRHTSTVAEILVKGGVVLLHSGCGRRVGVSHGPVDHVKACLPLIQPQLEAGVAAPREVLRPPLNVEDAVRSGATDRGEDTEPAVDQIQVVPVREDRVVVGGPWQALVGEGRIGGCELGIAVGRQIDRGEGLIVQRVREGQGSGRTNV